MVHLIVKPSKDEDFYVYYSTIVDMPIAWGTKAELLEELPGFEWLHAELDDEERWTRADVTGTSAAYFRASWAKDTTYNYGGYGWLYRSELKKLTDKFEELGDDAPEDHPEVLELIHLWKDEDD